MDEIFTPIPGFEKYGVSESGRVKNLIRQNILTPRTSGSCASVALFIDGKVCMKSVRKLVNTVYGRVPDGFYSIAGYEGKYFINKQGKIFSLAKGRYMAPVVGANGAVCICLSKDGRPRVKYVGRLVWETFVGKIPNGKVVTHKDSDFTNNSLDNLDARRRFLLTEEEMKDLVKERRRAKGRHARRYTLSKLAGKYGVSTATVGAVYKDVTGSYSLRKSKI